MSVNKLILVGHVGKDPEVRDINGNKVASFSVATSDTFMKGSEKVTETEWHEITVFKKLAEFVEKYVTKGNQVYLEGSIKTQKWTGSDGVEKSKKSVTCFTIQKLDRMDAPKTETKKEPEPEVDGDLPF